MTSQQMNNRQKLVTVSEMCLSSAQRAENNTSFWVCIVMVMACLGLWTGLSISNKEFAQQSPEGKYMQHTLY